MRGATVPAPSLRAQRSNPDCLYRGSLDCFVASAPRNDGCRSGGAPNLVEFSCERQHLHRLQPS
nr:hypothetical protein FNV92_06400 [Bradyrhizobium cosmicum]